MRRTSETCSTTESHVAGGKFLCTPLTDAPEDDLLNSHTYNTLNNIAKF